MFELKLNNQTINIPTNWEEITIGQQMEVERLSMEHGDLKSLAVIAGYCNISVDDLKKMNIKHVKLILDRLTFFNEPLPTNPISQFEYKGERFNVIQSLLKGEFQDFVSLETTIENYKTSPYKALPYVVAIMAKKQGESLSDFDIETRANHFLELPITTASRIQAFFLISARLFTVDSREILRNQNLMLTASMNYILNTGMKPVGGGIFSRLLIRTLHVYTRFLKKRWNTYYNGLTSETKKISWIVRFKDWFQNTLILR